MRTDPLLHALYQLPDFPDALRPDTEYGVRFRKHVDSLVEFKRYDHPEILLSAGHRANEMYFLNQGLARAYKYDDRSGDELTDFLWEAPAFVLDAESFYLQQPSETFLQVWEGEVISASYADLEETAQLFPEVLLLTRSVVVEQTKYYRQRLDNIRTMKAEARYRTLLEKHPRIVQNFPVYILASFLGIAPTSLSRLRRR
ncbi:MAG: hypothetical protein FWJ85_11020 [Solitalea sp.]